MYKVLIVCFYNFLLHSIVCFFTLVSVDSYAQLHTVVDEQFENNKRSWPIIHTEKERLSINGNRGLVWEKNYPEPKFIWQKFKLNRQEDFEIEASMIDFARANFGLIWSGIDASNAELFCLGDHKIYRLSIENGKSNKIIIQDLPSSVGNNKYVLTIKKQQNGIGFILNGNTIYTAQVPANMGDRIGLASLGFSKFEVSYLQIKTLLKDFNNNQSILFAKPKALPESVNTTFDETAPVIAANGKLYFSRRGDEHNKLGIGDDIFLTHLENIAWSKPTKLGYPINNEAYNYACSIVPNSDKILLANTYSNLSGHTIAQGVSLAFQTDTVWQMPLAIPIKNFYSLKSNNDFRLSADGKSMLMALERKDTRGKNDLYFSQWIDGLWSEPINLGNMLNTSEDEFAPFLAPDLRTLFFASRGHAGYGEADIFMSQRLDHTWQNWSKPVNLGLPLNSEFFEGYFNFFPGDTLSFFVSESEKKHDIFSVPIPAAINTHPIFYLDLQLHDSLSGKKIEQAHIRFEDLSQQPICDGKEKNKFELYCSPQPSCLKYTIEATGYYTLKDSINLGNEIIKPYEIHTKKYSFNRLQSHTKISLKNILFERGEIQISKSSYSELDKLYSMMKETPSMRIEIRGHTDNQGDAIQNQQLSQSRADNIKNYLVGKGIDSNRIVANGLGGLQPLTKNKSEQSRKLNRRVEFIVVP
jgi:outer membrane protein OmpA-like peptidoglycan-associated protein